MKRMERSNGKCAFSHKTKKRPLAGAGRRDDRLIPQAIRYGAAAFSGFAADYLMLLLLKEALHLHYLVAVPIAFVVGVAVNYLVGVFFVFTQSKLKRGVEIALFLGVSLAALAVTEGCMFLLTDALFVDYRVSRVLAGAATYVFNFLMRRWVLYGKSPSPDQTK